MAGAGTTFAMAAAPRVTVSGAQPTRREVRTLQDALRALGHDIHDREAQPGRLGDSTAAALRAVQERAGLPVTGTPTAETVAQLNAQVQHAFYTVAKTRTAGLQAILGQLGQRVDPDEFKQRRFGPTTQAAIEEFQRRQGLPVTGTVDADLVARLRASALAARLSSKTQIGEAQRTVLRAARIAKLQVSIDRAELKSRELGPTSQAAIRALQAKYRLPQTGVIDVATWDKIKSIAASRPSPVPMLRVRSAQILAPVTRELRLNMTNAQVGVVQQALTYLGHPVAAAEFHAKRYGPATRAAVLSFQTANGLPTSGQLDRATRTRLNAAIARQNPAAAVTHDHRVRGTVRDNLWQGLARVRVQVYERPLRGEGPLLAERQTLTGGFYDLPYDPPLDPTTKQPKKPYHLLVKFIDKSGAALGTRVLFNPSLIAWANLTEGDDPYRGTSEWDSRLAAVTPALGGIALTDIVESEQTQEVTRVALAAGLSQDDVMRLVLAYRVAREMADTSLGPPSCYAFIRQNLPPSLPDDLLAGTHEWTLIDQIVDQAATGLAFMDPELQAQAWDAAVSQNLIPITVGRQRDAVLAALAAHRRTTALDKPILVGNASLGALLDASILPAEHRGDIADAFVTHRGIGSDFWTDVEGRADQLGGAAAVADLRATLTVGQITKNHLPTLTFLKGRIADPNDTALNSARDLAKLSEPNWVALIQANGNAVPPGTDGTTDAERAAAYAATLAAQTERLFPTVAFVSTVVRANGNTLLKPAQTAQFVDTHEDLELRSTNVDSFVTQQAPGTDPDVVSDLRVLQRVHRLAPTAATGEALLGQKLHSSAQIVGLGKDGLVSALGAAGVDERTALTVHGYAEFQYAQVLSRIAEFRNELQLADPASMASRTWTMAEARQVLGDVPNLEVLFGAADLCDCAACQSVYSPAAYLADLLRFLSNHPARAANTSVQDVLFARRPDLGNLKLNCPNSETPLPYVDLVCEVLEAAVPAPNPDPATAFQTTRDAAELRAFPENVRQAAYDVLRAADFPMTGVFDLWQEESRVFLQHLGVPRHELMRAWQGAGGGAGPSDVSIAGEYFGLSSHETDLIVTAAPNPATQDGFWGLDTSAAEVTVSEFLDHAGIGYPDLLDLLAVRWLRTGGVGAVGLDRPDGTCDLDQQRLTGLTPAAYDRIHRLLRLWRRTGWPLWQLDLLIRAPGVGAGRLGAAALVALYRFALVNERLRLPFETALALYQPINTEDRPDPQNPAVVTPSLYPALFANTAVINPVDPAFALPLPGTEPLANHHPALLAALAVTETELTALLARTGPNLTLDTLTALLRRTALARALKLPVADLLTLLDLCAAEVPDPFADPEATAGLLDCLDRITAGGLAVPELDYLLNQRPDAPYGPRDEVVTQQLQALRESLRTTPAGEPGKPVAAGVATAFALTDQQAATVLATLTLNGPVSDHLADPAFTARAGDAWATDVTPTNFPNLYASWRLLAKVALVIRRLKMPDAALAWLTTHATGFGGLDFSDLPVSAPPAVPLWPAWRDLTGWLSVRTRFPEPEGASLAGIFDLVADAGTDVAAVRTAVATLTTWSTADLAAMDGGDKAGYGSVEAWRTMLVRFAQLRRLGVSARTAQVWARRDATATPAATVAQQIRQAAKSKYDAAAWLSIVAPLTDVLRERKRDALVAYLVERSLRTTPPTVTVAGRDYRNPAYWTQPDDLLRYFLIDVEMAACQLTSRVKQAISSTQMFVQRCLLNLEPAEVQISAAERADAASLDSWRQWEWMKNYRLWEANRKVFLYPENWILPELRDDKSPFFQQLENDILQGEITSENCEAALARYLRSLDEVSRLTVVGIYHELDDDNPYDNLPPNINLLHVIGKTRSEPARYFYRTFDLTLGSWTPWERIDLDITGDHVVPVVYNRKLHLFWLTFTARTQKVKKHPPAKPTDAPTDPPDPPNQLEIGLSWSVRREGGWTSKQSAPHKIINPWDRPVDSYNIRPRYKTRENQLWLDLYISTSQAFNNTQFYDAYKDTRQYVTAFRFDETARPWHASSFVFDGQVVAVKLKQLRGFYHVLDATGFPTTQLVSTSSYQYVHDNFGDDGRAAQPLTGAYEIAPRIALPDGMRYRYTRLTNNVVKANPNRLNVLEKATTTTLLNAAQAPFELAYSQHHVQFDTAGWEQSPFCYADPTRAFFVRSEWEPVLQGYNQVTQQLKYTWYPFYHPYTALFLRELGRSGVDGVLNRTIQRFPGAYYPGNTFAFAGTYQPTNRSAVDVTAQTDIVDFSRYGAYAGYNWEIFFHIPMLIAGKLSANQRFDEAMTWYHKIFDPTNTDAVPSPQRYWITLPFFNQNSDDYRKQRIQELLANIGDHLDEVRAWKNDPFDPHLIARYRPVAYQRAVVMKYLDNLIAWGDQLFRRDTLESINEATLLYLLAKELLGPKPVKVNGPTRADRSYNELVADGELDPFGNKRVDVLMENFLAHPTLVVRSKPQAPALPHVQVLYFGIPANDALLAYWDTVGDRLFKVRHCMNIEGAVRALPLFEPPIDPALLVKAAAAGVDLSSVLSPSAAATSQYRFPVVLGRALELCAEVRTLGDRLLGVLERYDAEGLAQLQSTNSVALQQAVREVREKQVDEAQHAWDGLTKGLDVIQKRLDYYGSIPRMNAWEIAGTVSHGVGIISEIVATVLGAVSGATSLIPSFTAGAAGFGGSPVFVVTYGGGNVASSTSRFAQMFSNIGNIAHQIGNQLVIQGTYTRQDEANTFQVNLANAEKTQLQALVDAAQVRYLIAQKELDNQDTAIEQLQAVDEFLHSKYTNQQLFDWMVQRLSTVYFQSYQLAYDMARRAEKCFQFELAAPEKSFIQFGYWDSLKKGLLAAERLTGDVHRMEAAYLDQNRRELELTKHVSLALVAPLSLLALKVNGSATVELPEWLFDVDHPGHYRRRIKSVALTIPCAVGPYTSVNCTLTLTNNGVRLTDDVAGGYGDPLNGGGDARFARNQVLMDSIATSHGVNDRGVFELRLTDERYLPFEGAGAVSQWELRLPQESNQFPLESISDVVLHVDYTAVAGSTALRDAAVANLDATLPASGTRLFVLDQDFGSAWYRMLHPDAGAEQVLTFAVTEEQLPFWARLRVARGGTATVTGVDLLLDTPLESGFDARLDLPGPSAPADHPVAPDVAMHNWPHLVVTPPAGTPLLGDWRLQLKKQADPDFTTLADADISHAYLVLRFGVA